MHTVPQSSTPPTWRADARMLVAAAVVSLLALVGFVAFTLQRPLILRSRWGAVYVGGVNPIVEGRTRLGWNRAVSGGLVVVPIGRRKWAIGGSWWGRQR